MQVEPHGRRAQGGLGIGLTLVKRLVEMHGGTVEARSEGPGRGSEFVVRLPLLAARTSRRLSCRPTPRHSGAGPRRVLVVDDNHDAAESLAMLLQTCSAPRTRVGTRRRDALRALPDFQPDVVLLDIGMPGMDGHEVARRIRARPEFDAVSLVALTGWGQEEDRRRSSRPASTTT